MNLTVVKTPNNQQAQQTMLPAVIETVPVIQEQQRLTTPPLTDAVEGLQFIESNTKEMSYSEMKHKHLIPVFVKDNEPVIPHTDFLEVMHETVGRFFSREIIGSPSIRVSHPIKGRIPEAKRKPAKDLQEWEKTIYYERMAFLMEIPSITETVNGQSLSLVIGGVRALNETNLYSSKGMEKFKVFIGFKVKVCTNLCVWSDGFVQNLRATNSGELAAPILTMMEQFSMNKQLTALKRLQQTEMSQSEFATMIGRAKMYQYIPKTEKKGIPELLLGDNQISAITKGYYSDDNFRASESGSISLWNAYNLFTDAVKSSYIDKFVERNVNSFSFINQLDNALHTGRESNWFLS